MGKRSSAHIKAQRAGRERDGNRCQICGSNDHVEGHHITSLAVRQIKITLWLSAISITTMYIRDLLVY